MRAEPVALYLSMDDSKTKVCSVRFAPAHWAKVHARAKELGIPTSRLVELATRAFVGEPVADHYRAVSTALGG